MSHYNHCTPEQQKTYALITAALEHLKADLDSGRDLSYLETITDGKIDIDDLDSDGIETLSSNIQKNNIPGFKPLPDSFQNNPTILADFEI